MSQCSRILYTRSNKGAIRGIHTRIRVPHDGSEMSEKALDKAIEFCKVFKSEIIILHIVDDRLLPSSAILGFIGEKSKLEDAKMQVLNILKVGAEAMLKGKHLFKCTNHITNYN